MATREKSGRRRKGASTRRAPAKKRAAKATAAPRAGKPAARGAKRPAAPARKAAKKPPRAAARTRGRAAGRGVAPSRRRAATPVEPAAEVTTPDPEGFFVARVRGEDEARNAPHAMAGAAEEGTGRGAQPVPAWEGAHPVAPVYDERLGELPSAYGDDAFVALPRDPSTLFLYWDLAAGTARAGFEGLEGPRAQLWILARQGEGWERVRAVELALESRCFYVNGLRPGRAYRAELQAVDRHGQARRIGPSSNVAALPTVGPAPIVDDRFVRIPWELPLPGLLGRGRAGGPFPDELRALLSRLSDWGRLPEPPWGAAAGARPSSPETAPSHLPGGER